MALALRQTQSMMQSLVMTPQLQQAIKLLQLNRLELQNAIQAELEQNPVLEEGPEMDQQKNEIEAPMDEAHIKQDEGTRTGEEKKAVEEFDWDSYFESNRFALPPSAAASLDSDEFPSYEATMVARDDLGDHLAWQLQVSDMPEDDRRIAARLLGDLEDSGYVPMDVCERVGEELELTPERVEQVLRQLQVLDPIGCCSRGLSECLLVQAIHSGHNDPLVRTIIEQYLPQVEKRNLAAIARDTKHTLEEVIEAVKVIEQLDPRPGRHYCDSEAQYITPDIYVYRIGDDFQIVLNEDGMPKLKISHYYKEALSSARGDAKGYIQDKLRSAIWLIRSIHQRQRTIYKVMESILKFQRPFFEHGVEHLRPLILRQVADDIGMHESTVSRVTSNKYVHTPQGIFELKYFFNSSISSSNGSDDVASEAVKSMIRQLVEKEDDKRPLSDQKLVSLIREKNNIDIARRTVAKYREMMGILSSSKRKKLY